MRFISGPTEEALMFCSGVRSHPVGVGKSGPGTGGKVGVEDRWGQGMWG